MQRFTWARRKSSAHSTIDAFRPRILGRHRELVVFNGQTRSDLRVRREAKEEHTVWWDGPEPSTYNVLTLRLKASNSYRSGEQFLPDARTNFPAACKPDLS